MHDGFFFTYQPIHVPYAFHIEHQTGLCWASNWFSKYGHVCGTLCGSKNSSQSDSTNRYRCFRRCGRVGIKEKTHCLPSAEFCWASFSLIVPFPLTVYLLFLSMWCALWLNVIEFFVFDIRTYGKNCMVIFYYLCYLPFIDIVLWSVYTVFKCAL